VVAAIANILKETRSGILTSLKKKGRMSVDELAIEMGVSKVSVRRHLELLGSDGLIAFETERQERGRPGHVYFLTDKAEMLFPTGYNAFALRVLHQVRAQFGESGIASVLCGQTDELIAVFKPLLERLSFKAKIEKLSQLLNERGYDVSFQRLPGGAYVVRQHNCPMLAVAATYGQVCIEELRLYRELLDVEVLRECRIAAGAQSCDYKILPGGSANSSQEAVVAAAGGCGDA